MLRDAGALIHTKTADPIALFAIETTSDLFGTTCNPRNPDFCVGASSGGGAALVACGGSKIDVGSDIGGSLRIPAHCCGIYSLKGSFGRFPECGSCSSVEGLESVRLVSGPMADRLEDLREFWKRIIEMKPWLYDEQCVPIPWREVDFEKSARKLRVGVLWTDGKPMFRRPSCSEPHRAGVIPPTPACERALWMAVEALRAEGHEVFDL